jgi:hypothetical protein
MYGRERLAGDSRIATLAAALGIVVGFTAPARDAFAYTDVGDRTFVSPNEMPPIAPGDEFYFWGTSQPATGGRNVSDLNVRLMKSITDRFGIEAVEIYSRTGVPGGLAQFGWSNFDTALKYLAIEDQPDEFLLSLGLDREWGGTGALRAGAYRSGATTPEVLFGKGFGDIAAPYLRPFAIQGFIGDQIADYAPRPNQITAGLTLEYSIPYLESKVKSVDIPDFFRRLTLLVEADFTIPEGPSYGVRPTALISPGVSYAGEGWEFLVEAMVPANRYTAGGAGVVAQLHLSLGFLFADTIGRPLFSNP